MAAQQHHVIVGNGVAGNRAAAVLRELHPDNRITIVSAGALLFYNRYELPRLFAGERDWRAYLVNPPRYYEENRIAVRRNCRVGEVDTGRRVLILGHHEEVAYDSLLVASGGRGYIPVSLREYAPLFHHFNTYRVAMTAVRALPEGGTVIMLGGDVLGIDLAHSMVASGHRVVLVPSNELFWPHKVAEADYPAYVGALDRMGIEVVEGGEVEHIEAGPRGGPARWIIMGDGREIGGDLVMPFYGLTPALDFVSGANVDIERGLLVNPQLHTTDPHIWAAGDVCQIWSPQENAYRFYYGWTNVQAMGEIAARNMAGAEDSFRTFHDETLSVGDDGALHSSFWEYEGRTVQ